MTSVVFKWLRRCARRGLGLASVAVLFTTLLLSAGPSAMAQGSNYYYTPSLYPNLFLPPEHRHSPNPPPQIVSRQQELIEAALKSVFRRMLVPMTDANGRIVQHYYFEELLKEIKRVDPKAQLIPSGGVVRAALSYIYVRLQAGETLESLAKESRPIAAIDVRGVGSDFDVFVEASSEKLTEVASLVKTRTNSAEIALGAEKDNSKEKRTLFTIADTKRFSDHLSRSVPQGGSTLDFLGFDYERGRFLGPPEHPNIVKDFIRGTYTYIAPTEVDPENFHKQLIRGFRALIELPHLTIKDETQIRSELEKAIEEVKSGKFPEGKIRDKALEQFAKMLRNSRDQGAKNRLWRGAPGSLEALFETYVEAIRTHVTGGTNPFPQFIWERPVGSQPELRMDPKYLVDRQTFVEKYTDKGVFYHGTPSYESALSIMRGGLFESSPLNGGRAAHGKGAYASPRYAVAQGYTDQGEGIIFPIRLNARRPVIVDWKMFKESSSYRETLQAATSSGMDHFDYLTWKYGVDIIINTHLILKNVAVLDIDRDPRVLTLARVTELQNTYKQMPFSKVLRSIQNIEKVAKWYRLLNPEAGHVDVLPNRSEILTHAFLLGMGSNAITPNQVDAFYAAISPEELSQILSRTSFQSWLNNSVRAYRRRMRSHLGTHIFFNEVVQMNDACRAVTDKNSFIDVSRFEKATADVMSERLSLLSSPASLAQLDKAAMKEAVYALSRIHNFANQDRLSPDQKKAIETLPETLLRSLILRPVLQYNSGNDTGTRLTDYMSILMDFRQALDDQSVRGNYAHIAPETLIGLLEGLPPPSTDQRSQIKVSLIMWVLLSPSSVGGLEALRLIDASPKASAWLRFFVTNDPKLALEVLIKSFTVYSKTQLKQNIEFFLRYGFDINTVASLNRINPPEFGLFNSSREHLAEVMVRRGSLEGIALLHELGFRSWNVGTNTMELAASYANLEILNYLRQHVAADTWAPEPGSYGISQNSSIYEAIRANNLELLQFLITQPGYQERLLHPEEVALFVAEAEKTGSTEAKNMIEARAQELQNAVRARSGVLSANPILPILESSWRAFKSIPGDLAWLAGKVKERVSQWRSSSSSHGEGASGTEAVTPETSQDLRRDARQADRQERVAKRSEVLQVRQALEASSFEAFVKALDGVPVESLPETEKKALMSKASVLLSAAAPHDVEKGLQYMGNRLNGQPKGFLAQAMKHPLGSFFHFYGALSGSALAHAAVDARYEVENFRELWALLPTHFFQIQEVALEGVRYSSFALSSSVASHRAAWMVDLWRQKLEQKLVPILKGELRASISRISGLQQQRLLQRALGGFLVKQAGMLAGIIVNQLLYGENPDFKTFLKSVAESYLPFATVSLIATEGARAGMTMVVRYGRGQLVRNIALGGLRFMAGPMGSMVVMLAEMFLAPYVNKAWDQARLQGTLEPWMAEHDIFLRKYLKDANAARFLKHGQCIDLTASSVHGADVNSLRANCVADELMELWSDYIYKLPLAAADAKLAHFDAQEARRIAHESYELPNGLRILVEPIHNRETYLRDMRTYIEGHDRRFRHYWQSQVVSPFNSRTGRALKEIHAALKLEQKHFSITEYLELLNDLIMGVKRGQLSALASLLSQEEAFKEVYDRHIQRSEKRGGGGLTVGAGLSIHDHMAIQGYRVIRLYKLHQDNRATGTDTISARLVDAYLAWVSNLMEILAAPTSRLLAHTAAHIDSGCWSMGYANLSGAPHPGIRLGEIISGGPESRTAGSSYVQRDQPLASPLSNQGLTEQLNAAYPDEAQQSLTYFDADVRAQACKQSFYGIHQSLQTTSRDREALEDLYRKWLIDRAFVAAQRIHAYYSQVTAKKETPNPLAIIRYDALAREAYPNVQAQQSELYERLQNELKAIWTANGQATTSSLPEPLHGDPAKTCTKDERPQTRLPTREELAADQNFRFNADGKPVAFYFQSFQPDNHVSDVTQHTHVNFLGTCEVPHPFMLELTNYVHGYLYGPVPPRQGES